MKINYLIIISSIKIVFHQVVAVAIHFQVKMKIKNVINL